MTMPRVELIYDSTCPNREKARAALMRAFSETGMAPSWTEWERSGSESPDYASKYGSPTILVDGEDVAGQSPGDGAATCRIYMDSDGRRDVVPPVDIIVSAFLKVDSGISGSLKSDKSERSIGGGISVLPAIGVTLLPKLTCPACWPAYAWFLGIFGISFVNYTPYLAPLMAFFLTLAVASLAFQAKNRRGYGPFALGLAASMIVMVSRFWLGSEPVMYAGFVLLVSAFIWNAWPIRQIDNNAPCPACAREGEAG